MSGRDVSVLRDLKRRTTFEQQQQLCVILRTASASEKVLEHIKRVVVLLGSALMSFQAILQMS